MSDGPFDAAEPAVPETVEVQRVAVRIVDDDGLVLAAGWLRHGDSVVETLARVVRTLGLPEPGSDPVRDLAASLDLRAAGSMPHELPGPAIRLHVLSLDHAAPPGAVLGPGIDETRDAAQVEQVLRSWADGGRLDPWGAQAGLAVMKVQRAGAYAVVRDERGLLLTRLTRTGRWTLPGGGIDPGEQPADALIREVFEETGFRLGDVRLTAISTAGWTGRAPDGVVEDFQAVQLLYTGTAPAGLDPRVVERDGSTSEAAWVRVGDLAGLPLTYVARSGVQVAGLPPLP